MIFSSIKKSIKLKKISKILGELTTLSVKDLIASSEKKEKAIDDLYALSKNFKYTKKRLIKHKIDKEKFKEIYSNLLRAGAGQWVKGHYVVASSLAFGSTLEYIPEELEGGEEGDWPEIAFNLIEYFEKGKKGKVK